LVDSNLLHLIKEGNLNGVRATLKSILGEGFPIEDIVKQVVTVQVATKAETIEN
jgi:hypothetical protein